MLVLCGGMTAFFLLAYFQAGMLGEGRRVQSLMLTLAGLFGVLTGLLILAA